MKGDANSVDVREVLVNKVDRKFTLVTDESALYTKVGKEFSGHEKMNHTAANM